ncbi:predicted protein [Arabidopsis lyrata subsp. lyrata]|uniref:Predicted protein n=1 Tax=Arabidopsis lyrata subsp. lyrata TaxID=81972 RepID=D7MJD6_ARALL|nr:predicted protein [Arabidopsis lyrata subsp. lyrata]
MMLVRIFKKVPRKAAGIPRELSSSKASSLAAIGGMIETEAIPVVEKYHKVMVARSGQLVYVQISFSDLTVLSQYMFYSFHVFAVSNPGNKE